MERLNTNRPFGRSINCPDIFRILLLIPSVFGFSRQGNFKFRVAAKQNEEQRSHGS